MGNKSQTIMAATVSIILLTATAWAVDWSKPVQYYKDGRRYDLLCHPPSGPEVMDDQGRPVIGNLKCDVLKISPE